MAFKTGLFVKWAGEKKQLLNVYRQLKIDAEAVIAVVNALDAEPCDAKRYMETRRAYDVKIQARESDAGCAALMIWLNKHCFNGLYRVNARGLFNVPFVHELYSGFTIEQVDVRRSINRDASKRSGKEVIITNY